MDIYNQITENPLIGVGIALAIIAIIVGAYYFYKKSLPPVILTVSDKDYAALGLTCPSGMIKVNSAQYASTIAGKCAGNDQLVQVGALCNGKPNCTINVIPSGYKMKDGSGAFGSLSTPDPCPGVGKTLNVSYQCA